MRNSRTNARRRAARRFIKKHSTFIANWLYRNHQVLVNLDNPTCDLIIYLNTLSKMLYETYVKVQKTIANPQDRRGFKMWYYSGYDITNIPHVVIKALIVAAIVNHINTLSDVTVKILSQDITPEIVEAPDIVVHNEPKYIIEDKSDKA